MSNSFFNSFAVSTSGMKAQSARMRIIMENIANVNTLPTKPGAMPYGRKTITFKNVLDRQSGLNKVEVSKIKQDKDASHMQKLYKPNHPAADKNGYVLAPNVSTIIEVADMQEASRSYQANLNALSSAKSLYKETVGLLNIQ